MFAQLYEYIPEFPLQESQINYKNFTLIKDTLYCDGNFIISNLLQFLLKKDEKVAFIAAQQNYAHYLTISKKTASSLEQYILKQQLHYMDACSEINSWVPQDLPYTEKTSNNFVQPPSLVEKIKFNDSDQTHTFKQILESLKKQIQNGCKHIVLDSLTALYNILENNSLIFQFFQELYKLVIDHELNVYLMVTCMSDLKLLKYIGIIEQQAHLCLEFFENPSGYQQDVAGQLIVKQKGGKAYKFLVSLTENQTKISRNYVA